MYNTTRFFNIDDREYALDYHKHFFCLLDEETKAALEQLLAGEKLSGNTEIEHKLNTLSKSNYFYSKLQNLSLPSYRYDTFNISFTPVYDCNFGCKYCFADYEGHKEPFTKEKIDELLEYIYIKKYSNYNKYKFDFVGGGEPLLNFDILHYFLTCVREFDQQLNKSTTVLIVTNGTLLTEDKIRILDKYDVFLGISVDGNKETHNRYRVYKNGKNTYEDVVAGINLLHASDVSEKLKNPWAMSVITKDTSSLVNLMENCIQLGFKRMQMQIVRATADTAYGFSVADLPKLKEHYKELFTHILERIKKGDLSRLKMIANDNDSFGKFFGRLLWCVPVFYRCFAGKNKISVDANGEIYPCDSFNGKKEFLLGSIKNEKDVNHSVFEQAHVCNRTPCNKCWARYLCGGDCYYASLQTHGDINPPTSITCEMNRFFIEHAIDLLVKIQEIDPAHINYLAKLLRYR